LFSVFNNKCQFVVIHYFHFCFCRGRAGW
jgi:hypothetical protein